MKRLLVFCDESLPPTVYMTGAKSIYNLHKELIKYDYELHFLTNTTKWTHPEWKLWVSEQNNNPKIHIHVLDLPLKKFERSRAFFSNIALPIYYFRYLKDLDFDIIHEYSSSPLLLNRTWLTGLLTKAKTVHTLCTHRSDIFSSPKFALKLPDRIICPSNYLNEQLKQHTQNTEIIHLPFIFNNNENAKPYSNLKAKGNNSPIVLFFAYLKTSKGIDDFLDVTPHFLKTCPESRSLIVTAPDRENHKMEAEKKQMVHLTQKNSNNRLIFWEKQVEPARLFASIDIFVYPLTTMHGTLANPTTLLEAMACGKAIIAPNFPELHDTLKDNINCLLYPPGDKQKLVDNITKLINDPGLRIDLGKNAKITSEAYNLKNTSKKLIDLYTRLLSIA